MLEHYYRILKLPMDSGKESIKKAYRQLALRMHPDVNDSPDATEKFQELCEAYEILMGHTFRLHDMDVTKTPTTEYVYNWEEVIKEAQEKARARARIRYEKIRAEQDLFEKGEWRDVIIMLKYSWSIIALAGGLFLVTWPVFTILNIGSDYIVPMLFFWVAGFFLLLYIYNKRRAWFRHGHIDLNFDTIRRYFDFSNFAGVTTDCAYSKGHKGNGRPFKLTLLKVRGVITRNDGPLRHHVNYNRSYKELFIPRSRKAFYVHFCMSFIKPLSLLAGIMFIPYPGYIWRFFIALFAVFALEAFISLVTQTRSKVSFLLTPFLIIKVSLWLLVMISQTYVSPGFILVSNDILILFMGIMFIFLDMFLDLLLRVFPVHSWFYLPIPKQLPGIDYLFKKGYQPFLDIPVWSTLYPFLRWLF